jgi:hypothetical protein
VVLPPLPSTNPYPYGKHALFTPTGPAANLATRGGAATEAAAAFQP